MKMLMAGCLLAVLATPAIACNSEMLTVKDWQASENTGNSVLPVNLAATVQYSGSKAFRMIHAGVMFADALGRNVGQVNLDEDQHAAPGAILVADGYVDAKKRLLTINRDDVVTRTCVWSIIYDDGSKQEFK